MAVIEVYCEVGRKGRSIAHVPEWLGCLAWGQSPESAVKALPKEFDVYIERLKAHVPSMELPRGRKKFEVAEEVFSPESINGSGSGAYFTWDESPLTKQELDRFLKLMEASRAWVTEIVLNIHPRVHSWKPAPGKRSIRKTLSYVETKERWYLSRLGVEIPKPKERSMLDLWRLTRESVVKALENLDNQQRSAVYIPRRGAANAIEKWTARRVLRRIVEHERIQAEAIKNIIAQHNAQRSS